MGVLEDWVEESYRLITLKRNLAELDRTIERVADGADYQVRASRSTVHELDVLARGVKHLHHLRVDHQVEEGGEVHPRRESVDGDGLNVTAPGNERTAIVSLTTSYSLAVIGTGEVVASGVVRTQTRFTQSNQAFAGVRAREDAIERAAVEGAELVALRLRAALATYIPATAAPAAP